MKKTSILLLSLFMISTSASAKSTGSAKASSDTTSYSRSAPQGGPSYFGLGMTTFTALGGTGGISALIPMGQHALQLAFVIETATGFSIGTSVLFKATVAGTSDTGFHLGGGLGFGVSAIPPGPAAVSLMLGGVMGIHHELVANKIAVSFDAGPVISVLPGVAFSLTPLSTLAGFSVHYLL